MSIFTRAVDLKAKIDKLERDLDSKPFSKEELIMFTRRLNLLKLKYSKFF